MRLHSDLITCNTDVQAVLNNLKAERLPVIGVWAETHFRGSRQRRHGFDLWLSADPRKGRKRRTNAGTAYPSRDGAGVDVAATWDEWGIVLNGLFTVDPDMTGDYYADAEHYEWSTCGRFANGGPAEVHDNHRWSGGVPIATGTYSVAQCTVESCAASRRWLTTGHKVLRPVFDRVWGEPITAGASA